MRRAPALIALLFMLQWALLMNIGGPSWDAAHYYSYGRSLVFDGDLLLENDLLLSYGTASQDFVDKNPHAQETVTGRVDSPFALGTGLLLAPLLALLRPFAESGFEWYVLAAANSFFALLGLSAFMVSHRLAAAQVGEPAGLIAVATLMFATPLLYYQFREPMYAHVASAFANALVVFAWWRHHETAPSWRQGALLGALLGLAGLIRWQNAVYGLLPLVSAIWYWLRDDGRPAQAATYLSAVGLAALLIFTPQFAVWRLFYGTWITVPQGGSFMVWTAPFLPELLLSPFRGLLPWMPVAAPAVAGLVLLGRKRPRLVIPLLLVVAAGLYVNASSRDWFAGGGYGPRRSSGELLIFVLGYAALVARLERSWQVRVGTLAGLALGLHQWVLLRYGLVEGLGGRVRSMAPDFRWEEASWREFFGQVAGHLGDAVTRPLDFFALPGSPVYQVGLDQGLPWRHAVGLAIAGAFAVGLACLYWAITSRWLQSDVAQFALCPRSKRPSNGSSES